MVFARKVNERAQCERKTLGPTSRKIDKQRCIHTYINMYIHTHTYTHIHMHMDYMCNILIIVLFHFFFNY